MKLIHQKKEMRNEMHMDISQGGGRCDKLLLKQYANLAEENSNFNSALIRSV